LGQHLCVAVRGKWLQILEALWSAKEAQEDSGSISSLRADSFANLPILNEWRRRFPQQDPVALHERLWNRRLVCPAGGTYVWNEAWQTMESSVYGHPGEPRAGPTLLPPAILAIERAAAGLTFEEDGLRARVEVLTGPVQK
jgi:hypothetical protein